jgi:hypothetical protein
VTLAKLKKKSMSNACSAAVMFAIFTGITVAWRESVEQCNSKISLWLYVYCGLTFLEFLKCIIHRCILGCAKNPMKAKKAMDILFCCTIENFRLARLIYGNTNIYTDESMECKAQGGHSRGLWRLMMAIIAFGYLYFALFAIIFCCGGVVLCCMLCGAAGASNPVVDKIPYMNAVRGLKKKEFTEVKDKNMD